MVLQGCLAEMGGDKCFDVFHAFFVNFAMIQAFTFPVLQPND